MLDVKFIRQNPEKVKEGIKKKGVSPALVEQILELDLRRRNLIKTTENIAAEENRLSSLVAKETDSTERARLIEKAKQSKNKLKDYQGHLKEIEEKFQKIQLQLPNLPLDDVPFGEDESKNVVLREVGEKTKFNFKPKDYLELAEKLNLIDIERAAKVAGTRFGYIKGKLAQIEFALVKLAFDTLTREGFVPIVPPVMLKSEMAKGMGYLEQADQEEAYYLPKDDLYLVGTAEQSVGVMYADEILEEKELPKRYVAFSTCFRREAGAYGKDTKGILRVHQFDKVEMFSFCHPEKSKEEHKFFLSLEEKLMKILKVPYRVVQLCSGDLGFPSASTFDIESWISSQDRYRETHSTSNCTDFQARRLNIRYKTKKGLEFVHTINGTAFAIGRTLIAIIENYQQKDGSIKVPVVLQKYLGSKVIK